MANNNELSEPNPSTSGGFIRRCLTFVPNLTPDALTTLVDSASWFQAQSLRPAVRGHIAGKTVMSVSAPPEHSLGFPVFRLELHLPFLVLRDLSDEESSSQGQTKKVWSDLKFLFPNGKLSILESHTTVVVSGADNFDWYGYAFGSLGPGDTVTDNSEEDDDDADDSDGEEGAEGWVLEEEDFFVAGGGCQQAASPGRPIMDPRVYYLRAVQNRLDAVVSSHENLVRKLDEGFSAWVSLEHDA
ncbi:hypothetical protein N0V86_004392 [Didymella sp. IMI 355093]|nr:hypothetical protein N0V86_004392 [Didymella sp. IMI 355093]